jgi:hypothetical protein
MKQLRLTSSQALGSWADEMDALPSARALIPFAPIEILLNKEN